MPPALATPIGAARLTDGYEMLRQAEVGPRPVAGVPSHGHGRLVLACRGLAAWLDLYRAELEALDARLLQQRVPGECAPASVPLRSALTTVLTDLVLSRSMAMA